MNDVEHKSIKTRRQLTQYLYAKLSSGAWGYKLFPNFDPPENWTDDPVSQREVVAAVREWQREVSEEG